MMKNRLSTPVFVFEDHVDFLKEWYSYAKRFGFTQREFLDKAEINANAFLSDVLAKRKKIGSRHVAGFIKALELKGDEQEYFALLVAKEKAKKPEDKIALSEKMAHIRKNNLSTMLENRTMEYYASWRYPVIREYLLCKNTPTLPKEIANALINIKLSTAEVTQALCKLVKWKMVHFDENTGKYGATGSNSISYQDMPHSVVNDVKRTFIEASIHAMEEMPKEERHISMTLKGVSEKTYALFCEKIDELRQSILIHEDNKDDVEKIIALNIQMFPVSKINRSLDKQGE